MFENKLLSDISNMNIGSDAKFIKDQKHFFNTNISFASKRGPLLAKLRRNLKHEVL